MEEISIGENIQENPVGNFQHKKNQNKQIQQNPRPDTERRNQASTAKQENSKNPEIIDIEM